MMTGPQKKCAAPPRTQWAPSTITCMFWRLLRNMEVSQNGGSPILGNPRMAIPKKKVCYFVVSSSVRTILRIDLKPPRPASGA